MFLFSVSNLENIFDLFSAMNQDLNFIRAENYTLLSSKYWFFFFFFEVFRTKTKKMMITNRFVIVVCLLLISITRSTTVSTVKTTTSAIATTLKRQWSQFNVRLRWNSRLTYEFWSRCSSTNFTLFVVTSSTIFLSTLITRWWRWTSIFNWRTNETFDFSIFLETVLRTSFSCFSGFGFYWSFKCGRNNFRW